MNKKIKLSLVDEDGNETDYINRSIPEYLSYNFTKGVLVDLLLLSIRNELSTDVSKNIAESARELAYY
jgi:hypothetical protein